MLVLWPISQHLVANFTVLLEEEWQKIGRPAAVLGFKASPQRSHRFLRWRCFQDCCGPTVQGHGGIKHWSRGANHSQQLKKNGNGELGMASYQFSDMAPSILLKHALFCLKFPEIAVPCDKQHEVNKLVLVAPAEIFKWRLGEKRIVLMRF